MKLYKDCPMDKLRIIGLSGMLIGNDNKIRSYTVTEELVNLESTFQSTIVTVDTIDNHKNVLLCSTSANESFLAYKKFTGHSKTDEIKGSLENMQTRLEHIKLNNYKTINPKSLRETIPKKVKDLILMFKDFEYQVVEMGIYGGFLSLLSMLIQFELMKRFSDTEKFRQIVKSCITITERCINRMEVEFNLSRDDVSTILINSSHKVQLCVKLLKKFFTDPDRKKDLQCIIFVKRRTSAKALYHVLKAYASFDPTFPIIPDFMVGSSNELPESIESILSSNYNSLTIEKFKNKETNCIVASSVLEEGIDLQMCNLVIMYDRPETYRSYVQARGRARITDSDYIVMVEQDKVLDFQKKVLLWRAVDSEIKKQLYLKAIDREMPSESDIKKQQEAAWEPFITPISRSVLSHMNSIR
jgi:endoribonuclease Dicer